MAARRPGNAGLPGGKPGPEVLARGGNNTWAPDVIRVGDRYFLYYSAPGTQPRSAIGLLVGKTLDPAVAGLQLGGCRSGRLVRRRRGQQRDRPGRVPRSRRTARCGSPTVRTSATSASSSWIRRPGKRLYPDREAGRHRDQLRSVDHDLSRRLVLPAGHPRIVLRRRELHLQHPHGPVAGKSPGPYLDNMGIDMLAGRRQAVRRFAAAVTSVPGISACSTSATACRSSRCHYEADLDRGGISVLDIRPLALARRLARGRRQLRGGHLSNRIGADRHRARTRRAGHAGRRAAGPGWPRRRRWPRRMPLPVEVIPAQDAAQVGATWPAGVVDVRLSPYMVQAQQKWAITPVANAGGYPGSPYFRITIAGTDRALAATGDGELVALPAFTGGPEQLWRIDQLTDGTYRVDAESVAESTEPLALSAVGSSKPTLAKFKPTATASAGCSRRPDASQDRGLAMLLCLMVIGGHLPPPRPRRSRRASAGAFADAGLSARRSPSMPGDSSAAGWCWSPFRSPGRSPKPPWRRTCNPPAGRVADRRARGCGAGAQPAELRWHALDTRHYNLNLYHFAWALSKPTSNVLFWVVTIVDSPVEMHDVRLAIGSNAASRWWLNGESVVSRLR